MPKPSSVAKHCKTRPNTGRRVNQFEIIRIVGERDLSRQTCAASDRRINENRREPDGTRPVVVGGWKEKMEGKEE